MTVDLVEWPLKIHFEKDGISKEFNDVAAIKKWTRDEAAFWGEIASNSHNFTPGAVQKNLQTIRRADTDDESRARSVLSSAADSYYTSHGALGRIVRELKNPTAAAIAFHDAIEPIGRNLSGSSPDVVAGLTAAIVYRLIGRDVGAFDRLGAIETSLQTALGEVTKVRSSDTEVVTKFEELIERADADWAKKIDGFESKVALGAPKAYWQARFVRHSDIARNVRRWWLGGLLAVGAVSGVAVFAFLKLEHPQSLVEEIIVFAQKVLIFGTLLAFAVWWLRQLLRDVRANEHLADDAAERVTMIETYAALRAAGLQDANLAPILAALYRPAMSGFVDDTGGPVMPLEILLKSVGNGIGKE